MKEATSEASDLSGGGGGDVENEKEEKKKRQKKKRVYDKFTIFRSTSSARNSGRFASSSSSWKLISVCTGVYELQVRSSQQFGKRAASVRAASVRSAACV